MQYKAHEQHLCLAGWFGTRSTLSVRVDSIKLLELLIGPVMHEKLRRPNGNNCCCRARGATQHFTFERYPVLLPLSPCDQLQLLLFLQGYQWFEEQPPCLAHHSLLLLIQQIQLLQRAEGLAAGVLCFRGSLSVLQICPAHLQLPHEVFVNVLPQGIAADRIGRLTSLGQDVAGARWPQQSRELWWCQHVCAKVVHSAVKVFTPIFTFWLLCIKGNCQQSVTRTQSKDTPCLAFKFVACLATVNSFLKGYLFTMTLQPLPRQPLPAPLLT